MSWARASLRRPRAEPPTACDPAACYASFRRHWQQANDIINKTQTSHAPNQDDVLGVVSHLEHLVTLLLLEIKNNPGSQYLDESSNFTTNGSCLESLLSENILDKLYEWGLSTGRFLNAVRVEQMKLYSLLMTHAGQQLLCAAPFLHPLLKLLHSCHNQILLEEVAGRLVSLLGQVCIVLMQKTQFVDLFFYPSPNDNKGPSFIPVMLLLSYVHREGSLGQQARAAFLLCATLSMKNEYVAQYISKDSNACPLLATGLSGLYSSLPRNIDIYQADWHRLTPDDVNDIPKLSLFMNSLEFCNAVAQVSHASIQRQLLDFFYQGFLLPVMGPALLQSGVDEQVAAIAYLELALRSVSDPGLLKSLIKFLLDKNYDGANILNTVIPFINGEPKLAIVTISLMETLIDQNCEDLMIELVFKYLLNGDHLMVSQRNSSLDCDIQCKATDLFLTLSPKCCTIRPQSSASRKNSNVGIRKHSISSQEPLSLASISEHDSIAPIKDLPYATYAYGLNASESLYGNYHAYLCEARRKISSCKKVCSNWSSKYNSYSSTRKLSSNKLINVVKDFQLEHLNLVKISSTTTTPNDNDEMCNIYTNNKEEDSLQSIGESSGYESFKYRSDDHRSTPENDATISEDEPKSFSEESFWKSIDVLSNSVSHNNSTKDVRIDDNSDGLTEIDIGPLLKITLGKLNNMLDNNVFVNLRLTGLISRLASYPLPILRSFLLCPWIVLQPSVSSLYQILVTLKQQIDESIENEPECQRLLEEGQSFLIDREIRLANTRKNAIESTSSKNYNNSEASKNVQTTSPTTQGVQFQNNADASSQPNSGNWDQPVSIQSVSVYEPFRRNEPKRKSLSSSIGSFFSRRVNSGSIMGSPMSNNHTQTEPLTSIKSASDGLPYSSLTEDNLWHSTNIRRIVLNALILDEWLKELGALAQEHSVFSISELMPGPSYDLLSSKTAQTRIL